MLLAKQEKRVSDFHPALSKLLRKAESILTQHNHTTTVLSILNLSNIHLIAKIKGVPFLEDLKILLQIDMHKQIPNLLLFKPLNEHSFLMLHLLDSKQQFRDCMTKLFFEFRQHQMIRDTEVMVSYRCGSVVIEDHDMDSAYAKAFMAMSEAMRHEGYRHLFVDEISDKITGQNTDIKMVSYFQDAVRDRRLRLAYQPIIDAKNGKIHSYECLLRIVTVNSDIISAGRFIPLAEKNGFIDIVDNLVLDLITSELEKSSDVLLSMNLSNLSVDNQQLLQRMKVLLHDPRLASRLTIEITETGVQVELKKMEYFINFAQDLGCTVAIDDFGAGYTSLRQLQFLRADIIKIDGTFITDIVHNRDNQFFVQMMISYANTFNMKVVAEFVENGEIAKVLMKLGVDRMQGNYFGSAVNYRMWNRG